jgi:hypothetical protein
LFLYLIPPTSFLGAILLTGYLVARRDSGALARPTFLERLVSDNTSA